MVTQPSKRSKRDKKLIIVLIVTNAAIDEVISYAGDEAGLHYVQVVFVGSLL
jgi:hypothetical protein